MSGLAWVWVFGSILIAGVVLALTLWFVVPAVLDLCADLWWWLRTRRSDQPPDEYEDWREQDCPDDAPDGSCWHCGAGRRESHSSDCPVYGEPLVGALPTVPVPLELAPGGDWREQTALELAPEHLAAEAERIDLPALVRSGDAIAGAQISSQGGETNEWPTDTRLPAILNLGRPGDGTDKTFARWQVAQWDHMTRIHADEERVERELAWGRAA